MRGIGKAMELIACRNSLSLPIYQITDEEIEAVRASLMSLLARHEGATGRRLEWMEFKASWMDSVMI